MNRGTGESTSGACASDIARDSRESEERRATFLAPVDVYETGEEIVVIADVPGARGEDVDVSYEDGTLTIRAGVSRPAAAGGRSLLSEYGVGDFTRTLRFGQALDVAGASANVSNGVLTLRLPKAAEARARKIQVATN